MKCSKSEFSEAPFIHSGLDELHDPLAGPEISECNSATSEGPLFTAVSGTIVEGARYRYVSAVPVLHYYMKHIKSKSYRL